jgi:prepilin-type processing-associated H-X9-DG protein
MSNESRNQPQSNPPPPAAPAPPRSSRALLWVALAVGVGALLLLVFLVAGGAKASPRQMACGNNLRMLGIAMHIYADECDGAFPTSPGLLYPWDADNPNVFVCPADPRGRHDFRAAFPEPRAAFLDQRTSYAYLPGQTNSLPGTFILMHDKPGTHSGGINVLYVDACVEWWPGSRRAEFQRRVELQNEAVAKWRAAGRPAKGIDEFVGPELRKLLEAPRQIKSGAK